MNSLALRAVAAELHPYRGLRFESAGAVDPFEFHLRLEKDVTLVASVHPEHNALFPAPAGVQTAGSAHPFARALEKALAGTRFAGASQAGLDRVIALTFERRDRLGDVERIHLSAELTGKGGNLILVAGDEPWSGRILERLRDDRSRRAPRRLAPGAAYELPPTDRADATRDDAEHLTRKLHDALERRGPVPRALIDAWTGLGPATAEEVWLAAGPDPDKHPEAVTRAWLDFLNAVRPAGAGHAAGALFSPTISATGEALVFQPKAETGASGGRTPGYPTASAAVAAAHRRFREHQPDTAHGSLERPLRQAIERTERALAAVDRDEHEAAEAPRTRRAAEAILAAALQIPRGADHADLTDPRSGEPLHVELDPARNPGENAEQYFKRARKAERSAGKAARRRRELTRRREALEDLAARLHRAGPDGPDPAWFDEAQKLGVKLPRGELPAETEAGPEDRLTSALRPRRYDLGNGWEVLVGKSNRGNEVLTLEIARSGDVWMHADQAPGSHVVLRHHEKGKEPPREMILAAASIAAFFSKARGSGKVPVVVTEKRHVRRPRKAPVGTVTVGRHKTVMVSPRDPDKRSRS
jgi:predicted ribosome quality control (RQC) complex YloA/Tae2 family protein